MSEFNYAGVKNDIKQLPTIGSIVWWSIQNVDVSRDRLAILLSQHDLPEGWLPAPIKGFNAFKKALDKVKKEGLMFRPILHNATENEVVYGVVREEKNKELRILDYSLLNKITFQPLSNSLIFDNDSFPCGTIEPTFEHYKDYYTSIDIRSMLLDIIKDHLFCTTIRESGGTYFVSSKFAEHIDRLETLVTGISSSSKLYSLGILDTRREKDIVIEHFRGELQSQISQIYQEIMEIDFVSVQQRVLTNKRNALSVIDKKISVYEEIMLQPSIGQELKAGIELCRKMLNNGTPMRTIY